MSKHKTKHHTLVIYVGTIPDHRVECHVPNSKVPNTRYQFVRQPVQYVLKCIPSVIKRAENISYQRLCIIY